jgi:ABC-2 type transport system permease protein
MNQILTIAKREVASLFFSPIAYVILGLFGLISSGFFLIFTFSAGQPASMRATFWPLVFVMSFLLPAVCMRLLSEEFRSGTVEMLMTAPVSDSELIIGKWLGAFGFLIVLLVPVAIQIGILEIFGHPDYGPILTGLLGILLLGGLYLAIGTFASSLTQNQIIALLIAISINVVFSIGTMLAARFLSFPKFIPYPDHWRQALFYASLGDHLDDFSKGIIDPSHVIFFVTLTGLFLFFAMLTLQSRRWR